MIARHAIEIGGFRRLAFGVWRLAFGVWRFAQSVGCREDCGAHSNGTSVAGGSRQDSDPKAVPGYQGRGIDHE